MSGLKIIGIWIAITFLFIGELFFYTWCRVQCTNLGYDISEETEKRRKLKASQGNLKIELAHLKSPERIAEIATQQIGLVIPAPKQMVIISQ